jgi:hypothetical protein
VLIPYGSGQLGISVLSLRLRQIVLVEVAREELPALVGEPPDDGSAGIFGVRETLLRDAGR